MEGTVKLEDKQRLAQEEENEAKRLAIMMMKKREKYLYNKIMFGKRRKIREVSPRHPPETPGVATGCGCTGKLGGRLALLCADSGPFLSLFLRLPVWPGLAQPLGPPPRPVWAAWCQQLVPGLFSEFQSPF